MKSLIILSVQLSGLFFLTSTVIAMDLSLTKVDEDCIANRLRDAVYADDKETVAKLFQRSANPNKPRVLEPILFAVKNIDIAKMFIAQKVDINASGDYTVNVLWSNIDNNRPSELTALFIANGADVKQIHHIHRNCLLHHFADTGLRFIENENNYINIGNLLVSALPDMINALNRKGQTPLDVAIYDLIIHIDPHMVNPSKLQIKQKFQQKVESIVSSLENTALENTVNSRRQLLMDIVKLFKKNGGKTAQELKNQQQKNQQQLGELKEQHYRLGAKDFLEKITDNNRLGYDKAELVDFLNRRIKNSLAQNENESRTLCSQTVLLRTLHCLDTNTSARVIYYFAKMVEENCVYKKRKELKCYITGLNEYEQSYGLAFQCVTPEEYSKRLDDRYTAQDLINMKFEESRKLAEDILSLLR